MNTTGMLKTWSVIGLCAAAAIGLAMGAGCGSSDTDAPVVAAGGSGGIDASAGYGGGGAGGSHLGGSGTGGGNTGGGNTGGSATGGSATGGSAAGGSDAGLGGFGGFGDVDAAVEDRVVLVVIDGARYSETLGDPQHLYTPNLASLAEQGCAPGPIMNTGLTITIAGTSAIHTGAWNAYTSDPVSGEVCQVVPTHWEYLRKQRQKDATDAYYFLKSMSLDSLWKPSRHTEYGETYWPTFVLEGNTDTEVFEAFKGVIYQRRPTLSVIYLADVDSAGHSGDWQSYTSALSTADSIVGQLWEMLQVAPGFAGHTTMLVTSDHGRHSGGGYADHGDACEGCTHVTFLAIGPGIDHNCTATTPPRTIVDVNPTIGRILGYEATYSEGAVMEEIFAP